MKTVLHKIDVFYEKVIVFGQKKNYSNRSWGGKYAVCFSLFLTLSSSIKQRSLNWLWFFININLHVVYFYGMGAETQVSENTWKYLEYIDE